MKENKTIFALSTVTGKSALAVIRISGPESHSIVKRVSKNMPNTPNLATFNEIISNGGNVVDQSITTFFKSPKSFTGEDMVELTVHGSRAVIKKIYSIFLKEKRARIANPGEFTRRAFENNKLDLTQVEAIADIVNSETEIQRKQAISHLSGAFFKSSKKTFEKLKKILANVEAIIDFSEEELPEDLMVDIKEQIRNTIEEINKILDNSLSGISIRDGFLVAILGKPNTGKSSFLNYVSGKNMAIVTSQPGTTRDLIESFIDIGGYPIKLVDTAGIRETKDVVEKIGVEKAYQVSKDAIINIVFVQDKKDIKFFKNIKNTIFVKSKQDITKKPFIDDCLYNISSINGYGIENLLSILKDKVEVKNPNEMQFISRERHAACLKSTVIHLEKSKNNKNVDIFAEDIRQALKIFSTLFGSVDIEDILDIIFNDFCIGK